MDHYNPLGLLPVGVKAAVGFEPTNKGFAVPRLRPLGYAAETEQFNALARNVNAKVEPGQHIHITRFPDWLACGYFNSDLAGGRGRNRNGTGISHSGVVAFSSDEIISETIVSANDFSTSAIVSSSLW